MDVQRVKTRYFDLIPFTFRLSIIENKGVSFADEVQLSKGSNTG